MAVNPKKRIVFLCSGGGGNLAFIHHAIQQQWLKNTEIIGVIADRHCAANAFSDRVGMHNVVLSITRHEQADLLSTLEAMQPDLIVTTIHKIISPAVLEKFSNRVMNLHYSILPAFSGLIGAGPVKAALEYSALFSGVSVHSVVEEVDAGPPIVQCAIALGIDEITETLMPVVFRCGCIALLQALGRSIKGDAGARKAIVLDILGRKCIFNGCEQMSLDFVNDEMFWKRLKKSVDFS